VRIIRVELDNIKSYRRARIPLDAGTIAVRGHNGAGKSTLLEAIGFALFDALPYDQGQFVREGERAGTVTVAFVSALDDREYHVVRRCGSNPAWYVYDPELDLRVVEQRTDVVDFLRRHLRLEGEIGLRELFSDALGVPQGTFTADFLLTPANRKKKFDVLLQVEDYRKAAEKLNDTRNYLLSEQRAAQKRIDDLERETGQLDVWRADLRDQQQRMAALGTRLAELARESLAVEGRRKALEAQRDEVTRLESAAQLAAEKAAAAQGRTRAAASALAEARDAVAICAATSAGYEAQRAAQVRQVEATRRTSERDGLARERADAAQALEGERRDLGHARARLGEAREAERRIVALLPAVARQTELERARDDARRDTQLLAEAERTLAKIEREQARIEHDAAEAQRTIAALEALRPEAAQLEERREQVAMLQAIRAQRTERQNRLANIGAERDRLLPLRAKAAQQEAKARDNVRKLRESEAEAARVPTLEAELAAVQGDVQKVEARLEHHRLSREQSGAGNCPFLREPCLNIQKRGENNLATYFDRLIETDELAASPLRERMQSAAALLEHARAVRVYYDQLPQYEERQRQQQERLAELDDGLTRLDEEQAEIEQWVAASPGESELQQAQVLFKASDEADKRVREIGPLQAELGRLTERLAALATERAMTGERAQALANSREVERAADDALASLGDPRGQTAGYERAARERPALEQRVEQLEAAVSRAERQVARLDEALAPFAGLDAELSALHADIERTRDAHTRYLQHEQLAGRVSERETAATQAEREHQAAEQAQKRAAAAYAAARSRFDPDELERASRQESELHDERVRATADLAHTQDESARLSREIARAEALLADLRAAREEFTTLKDDEAMLEQFRNTIKEAGPNVMKARLKQISSVANRLFGDIMGDRSAELAWENDYEIVLRRDGKERTFAQLSGGEQMSAALAVRLALLRHLTRLDIAFFDEPTQNMDGERRGNLAEQIRRVRGFDQLLVISHDDTFEQGLDSVIYLEKRNGETIVVEEGALVPA
jgi:DNA repair protein SbcC/Rad50